MLNEGDKRQFVERGYLVRQLDFDPAVFASAIDLADQHLDPQLARDEPHSWQDAGPMLDSRQSRTIVERHERHKPRAGMHPVGWLGDVVHCVDEAATA